MLSPRNVLLFVKQLPHILTSILTQPCEASREGICTANYRFFFKKWRLQSSLILSMVRGLVIFIPEIKIPGSCFLDPGPSQYIVLLCNLLNKSSSFIHLGKIKPHDNHLPNNEDQKSSYIFLYVTQIKSDISIYQLQSQLLSNIPAHHRGEMSPLSELGHAQNQDVKGKLYKNGFSVPTIPAQSQSLHNNNNPTTTTTAQPCYIPLHASSTRLSECWELLRMHFSALKLNQSINQCLLNGNYALTNYAIHRLYASLKSPLIHPVTAMCSRIHSHISRMRRSHTTHRNG